MSALRLYTFVNMYLSSIQQGIQTQHVAQELVNKYVYDDQKIHGNQEKQSALLREWSVNHKTTIVLNGGTNEDLHSLLELLKETNGLQLPFAFFNEDQSSLGSIMTSIAIILPEDIYDTKSYSSVLNSIRPTGKREMFIRRYPQSIFSGSWFWFDKDNSVKKIHNYTSQEANFLALMKGCSLAR